MSKLINKAITYAVSIGALTSTAYMYQGYSASIKPSNFHIACTELGYKPFNISEKKVISQIEQEEALLRIFHMAGYFKPENLWHDINKLGVEDPKKLFLSVIAVLKESGAFESDPAKFNAKIMRKNLFKSYDLAPEDAMDFIAYLAQHAFNRSVGQERNELKSFDWMKDHKDLYMSQATKLGLVVRKPPEDKEYDAGWIAGASRVGVLSRVIDYIQLLDKVKVNGESLILAGARPLWAEIDGVMPSLLDALLKIHNNKANIETLDVILNIGNEAERTEEGKEYIKSLAEKNGIKLNPLMSFKIYNKDDCPKGLMPGRNYPNYADDNQPKLTESLMSLDVLKMLSGNNHNFNIVDTASEYGLRPTTASTSRDAAKKFVLDIIAGKYGVRKEFKIIHQTNNPYIERQTLAAQIEVDKVLKEKGLDTQGYKIILDGVGFSNKQDVSATHSEFAALMAVKWQAAEHHSNRDPKSLLFQTRDKTPINEPMPDYSDVHSATGVVQLIFDEWLE